MRKRIKVNPKAGDVTMDNANQLRNINIEGRDMQTRDIGEVLRLLMREHNIRENDLARKTKVTQSTVNRILSGESKEPRDSTIEPLAAYFGVTLNQLKGREPIPGLNSNIDVIPQVRPSVPLISWNNLGGILVTGKLDPADVVDWLPCPTQNSNRTIALQIKGDAMVSPYPGGRSYPDGTIVFADPEASVLSGDRVIAYLQSADSGVFRTYVEEAGKRYLIPANPHYERIVIDDDVNIYGAVVASMIKEK